MRKRGDDQARYHSWHFEINIKVKKNQFTPTISLYPITASPQKAKYSNNAISIPKGK